MKLGQNACLNDISDILQMIHVGSKTWSQGQILEKPCICFRDYIFSLILMKLSQNVCLNDI